MNRIKIIMIILAFTTSCMVNAQSDNTVAISFENTRHDFGTIPYKGDGSYNYIFTNTGSTPLVISNCVKGCGCTNVTWTKEPIAPGKKGVVTATYNTGNVGYFNKGVDVYSNTTTPKINLRLTGTVAEPTEEQINALAKKEGPKISFEKREYDLGSFQAGMPVVCVIKFSNAGTSDLHVINCIRGKGILDLDGNRQTIAAGREGIVKVICKTNSIGPFATSVVFYTNIGVPVAVHIKGEVVP